MKLYQTIDDAMENGDSPLFLPRVCPFSMLEETTEKNSGEHLCGNWCPHFHTPKGDMVVILSCGGRDCVIKLEK